MMLDQGKSLAYEKVNKLTTEMLKKEKKENDVEWLPNAARAELLIVDHSAAVPHRNEFKVHIYMHV